MKKLSFASLVVFASIIVCSCQPPKQGDSSSAPGNGNGVQEQVIEKNDSSVEKAIQQKNLKDSVMEGKK